MSDDDGPGGAGPGTGQRGKQHESFAAAGTASTRELRDVARRRREAEEKLQQHLRGAKEKPVEE